MGTAWFIQPLIVGVGGFIGSMLRFVVSSSIHRVMPLTIFPVGTLVVNVLGCAIFGGIAGLVQTREVLGNDTRLFLFVGLLGGFTTFSTFGWETLSLIRDAERLKALLNVILHVCTGIAGAWGGYVIVKGW